MIEARHGFDQALHTKLVAAFQAIDCKCSGLVSSNTLSQLFDKLGLCSRDVEILVEASGSSTGAKGDPEVDYDTFLRWMVGNESRLEQGEPGREAWIEKVARVLETRGEADFVQKKLVTAQVRAHLETLRTESNDDVPTMGNLRSQRIYRSLSSFSPSKLQWDGAALMQRLLEGVGLLPVENVTAMLDAVLRLLPSRHPRPVVRLLVPQDGRVVVVGDTHGQLQDVLLLFLLHGMPNEKNIYLFNGDIADRGSNACEIFLLIFAFFLSDPDVVYVTRGNHEDEYMNMMSADEGGGFYDECLNKYGEGTYNKFVEIFMLLPLAAVIHDEVFVVHGGVPRGTPSLSAIDELPHTKVCCPAPDAEDPQDLMFVDLLWSDPSETQGRSENPRGCGSLWGPDVTKAFLKQNNLRWILRSHELPDGGERGWMEHHLGLVFTIFSASNYQGYEVNWGAIALLTLGSDGRVEQALREHNVPDFEELHKVVAAPAGVEREQICQDIGLSWMDCDRVAVGERRVRLALRRMAGIVLDFKPSLWRQFRRADAKNLGTIVREAWLDCLVKVCGDTLPWMEASKCWLPDGGDRVDYRKFLHRFKVVLSPQKWFSWKSAVLTEVFGNLLQRKAPAMDIFHLFDPIDKGVVEEEVFKLVLQECSSATLTASQLSALSRAIFGQGRGGGLRVNDFLYRFTLSFAQAQGMVSSDASPLALSSTIDQIGKLFSQVETRQYCGLNRLPSQPMEPPKAPPLDRLASAPPDAFVPRSQVSLVDTFLQFNGSKKGFLEVRDFVRHVMELPGFGDVRQEGRPLSEECVKSIAQMIAEGDDAINLLQFVGAFVVTDVGNASLEDDLNEHVLTFIYRHRHALRSSCCEHDGKEAGRVSRRLFAMVLEAVNFCAPKPASNLTRAQMDALVESITEDDDMVDYESFLASLEVRAE